MKLFAVSDVHGCYTKLKHALQEAGYDEKNSSHRLIVCGDLFDRGNENRAVYLYLKRLNDEGKAVILKGNHEHFFDDVVNKQKGMVIYNVNYNGFGETLEEFSRLSIRDWSKVKMNKLIKAINGQYPELLKWVQQLPYYYETKNYLFTHAGIDIETSDWRKGRWDYAVWNDLKTFQHVDLKQFNFHKKLVMGHYPTIKLTGDENGPIYFHPDHQKIFIDSGAVYADNPINVLVIEDELLD